MDKLLLRNIVSLFSIQAVNYLLPLLIIPLLIRVLGIELFGVYILIFTVVQYFIIASDYGFNLTATRKIAINIDDKKYVSKVFYSVIAAKLLIALAGLVVMNVFILLSAKYSSQALYLNVAYLSVFGGVFFPVWLYQAYEKMTWIAICNFISRVTGVILVFLFVNHPDDLGLSILIQGMMPVIAAVIALRYCFKNDMVCRTSFKFKDIITELKDGWDIFVSTSFVSLYTTSIPLILGATSGVQSVGVFSAADKIRLALQAVINPISQALYPRFSKLVSKQEKDKAKELLLAVIKFFLIPFCVFTFILMLGSDFIINKLYGPELPGAVSVLQILIWIPPIVAVANLLGIQIMLPKGMTKQFSITYIISGIVGFPLLFIGARYFSYIGVSVVSIIIELIVVSLFGYFILKSRKA